MSFLGRALRTRKLKPITKLNADEPVSGKGMRAFEGFGRRFVLKRPSSREPQNSERGALEQLKPGARLHRAVVKRFDQKPTREQKKPTASSRVFSLSPFPSCHCLLAVQAKIWCDCVDAIVALILPFFLFLHATHNGFVKLLNVEWVTLREKKYCRYE